MRLRIAFAVAASLAGACLFPSLSDLTDGDAAADAQQEGGGADVSSDAASDAPLSCKNVDATFCEDFDDTNQQAFPKWDYVQITDGGQFLRVDAGLSPPNAGEVIIAPTSATTSIPELLGYTSKSTATHVHLAWDCIVDQGDTTSQGLELNELETSSSELGIRVSLRNGGATLAAAIYPPDAAADFLDLSAPVSFDPGVWHHVEWTVDLTTKPATLEYFSIDGVVRVSDAGIPGATFGPSVVTFYGGVYYANAPTSGWRIRIDNVVLAL